MKTLVMFYSSLLFLFLSMVYILAAHLSPRRHKLAIVAIIGTLSMIPTIWYVSFNY